MNAERGDEALMASAGWDERMAKVSRNQTVNKPAILPENVSVPAPDGNRRLIRRGAASRGEKAADDGKETRMIGPVVG